jgi:hypothetical protein
MGIAQAGIKVRSGRRGMEVLLFTTNRQSAEPADCRVIDWPDRKRQQRRLLAPLFGQVCAQVT